MITLHSRDTYIPGMHKAFGSTYVFSIPNMSRRNQHGVFTLSSTVTHYLNLGGDRSCQETPAGSMESCIDNYVQGEVGCRFVPTLTTILYLGSIINNVISYSWQNSNGTLPQCHSQQQQSIFLDVTKELQELGEQDIVRKTGCIPSCWRMQVTAEPVMHNVVDLPRKGEGHFRLQAQEIIFLYFMV